MGVVGVVCDDVVAVAVVSVAAVVVAAVGCFCCYFVIVTKLI